ncbi:MAG: hypothetical protein OER77_04130 [Myxococcales bacterium]|nr:hypothetical protein [Myxococcales bacterium]
MLICTVIVTGCANDPPPPFAPGSEGGFVPDFLTRVVDPGGGGAGGGLDGGIDSGVDGGVDGGWCDNLPDLEALAAANVSSVTALCTGLVCLNTLGNTVLHQQCVSACLEQNISGLSSECAVCYAGVAGCALDALCYGVCQFNTCGLQCLNCLSFAGCLIEFEACRGIPGTVCDGPPDIPITDNQ